MRGRRVTGYRYRRLQMPDWNQQVIDEFRANGGRVGGPFEGRTLLLLHHRGAKSGTERVNPVAYQRLSDDAVAVFASKGGGPTNPDWYHNLIANPDVAVEIGSETMRVRARVADGEERERIWERQKHDWPGFADYEAKTKGIRSIPVIVLEEI
jgi:deazaflavin-dependent oxidoreductase (nitroreductase family)